MDSAVVLSLCKKYGPRLGLPATSILSPVAVMCAFAENESSFGANTKPRHEATYARGGLYDRREQAVLLDRYGDKAAFSYGPWQTLPCNALAYSPDELDEDPEKAAAAFVQDFNHRVLSRAQTLGEMGQVYNSGHVVRPPNKPTLGVMRYVSDLQAYYVTWFNKLKNEEPARAPSVT